MPPREQVLEVERNEHGRHDDHQRGQWLPFWPLSPPPPDWPPPPGTGRRSLVTITFCAGHGCFGTHCSKCVVFVWPMSRHIHSWCEKNGAKTSTMIVTTVNPRCPPLFIDAPLLRFDGRAARGGR